MAQIEVREIRRQREDEVLGKWMRAIIYERLADKSAFLTKEDQVMEKKFDSLSEESCTEKYKI